MKYLKTKLFVLAAVTVILIALFFFVTPELQATDVQVSDLTLTTKETSLAADQLLQVTIQDKNPTDTKVMLPLNGNLSYLSVSKTNAVVTKDEQNEQLIIDWPDTKEKEATLTFKILQPGNYSLMAKTLRNQQIVHSTPLTIKATEPTSDTLFSDKQKTQIPKLESRSMPPTSDIVQPADFDNQSWLINEVNKQLSPKEIGTNLTFEDLKKIQTIKLVGDGIRHLTGAIPDGIKYLTNLTNLTVNNQDFSGSSIPESIGELKNLQILSFDTDELSGTIPASIFNLPNIKMIDIKANRLTGTIPSNIGNAQNLKQLYLGQNELTGYIPDSIGSFKQINVINLDQNQLTGPIPKSFLKLDSLFQCNLNDNMLVGPIDDFANLFAKLIKIYGSRSFNLSNNELSIIDPKTFSIFKTDNPNNAERLAKNMFHVDYPNNNGVYELPLTRYINLNNTVGFPMPPGSKLYLFSQTAKYSLKLGKRNLAGTSLLKDNLSKAHRYTIWDSDGKMVYDGLPDDNASIVVPEEQVAYTVQIDNPNPPLKTTINDTNLLGYSIAGFRLNFHTLTSFKSTTPENVDPKTNTIKGEVGDTFSIEADIEGKGIPFYPGITIYHTPVFNDRFQLVTIDYLLSPEMNGKISIDPKSFKVNGEPPVRVDPITNGYRLELFDPVVPALQGQGTPLKVTFNVSTLAPVSLEEGKNAIQTFLMLFNGPGVPPVTENSTANVSVKRGLLQFRDVPATLEFEKGEISGRPVLIQRKDPNWQLSVEDSHIKPNTWQVKARLLTPFTNQKNQGLPDSLVYRQDGQPDKLINTTGDTVVYTGKGDGLNDYYSVSWSKNEGPVIKVLPGLARVGSPYVGQIQWTLSNAPV